jgi:hypothetical protein
MYIGTGIQISQRQLKGWAGRQNYLKIIVGDFSRVVYHGVTSSFFGIGILLVSDLLGFRYFRSVLLYCKFWWEHLFKISRELFF